MRYFDPGDAEVGHTGGLGHSKETVGTVLNWLDRPGQTGEGPIWANIVALEFGGDGQLAKKDPKPCMLSRNVDDVCMAVIAVVLSGGVGVKYAASCNLVALFRAAGNTHKNGIRDVQCVWETPQPWLHQWPL